MNPIAVYLCIFSTLLVFSLVSKGNETCDRDRDKTLWFYVYSWGSVCVCCFLPLPQRNCSSTGCKKIHGQVDDFFQCQWKKELTCWQPRLGIGKSLRESKIMDDWGHKVGQVQRCWRVCQTGFPRALLFLLVSWRLKHCLMQRNCEASDFYIKNH